MPAVRSFLVIAFLSCAVAAQSPVGFDSTNFDFGRVTQGDVVEHRFVLRNGSTTAVRVVGVDLTPPLRLAKMPAQIEPGASVPVTVVLDSRQVEGAFQGKVRFRFNDPGTPATVLAITGRVIAPVEFRPRRAFFVAAQRGHSAESTIDIINNDARPLVITRAEYPAERFTASLKPVEPGRRYRLTLTLRPEATAGRRQDRITLHTEDPQRVFHVAAHTLVRERVYTFPEAVDMGSLPRESVAKDPALLEQAAQTLMVYQAGGKNFRVKFSTDVPDLVITAEPGPQGDRWQATVRRRYVPGQPDSFRGSITISTNDSEFPTLTVPVSGSLH